MAEPGPSEPASGLSPVCPGCGPRPAGAAGGQGGGTGAVLAPDSASPRPIPASAQCSLEHISQGQFGADIRMGSGTQTHVRIRSCP